MSSRSEQVADDVLVTGAAGFIGFHVARRLLDEGRRVVGLDNINSYYDPALKRARLDILRRDPRFSFVQIDLGHRSTMAELFAKHRFARVAIWPLRPASGIRSISRTLMSTPILRGSSTSSKAAGITPVVI